MRAIEFINETDSYQPPKLSVGDKILKGKFKNSPAEIKGFTKDKHNQPVLKTNKGEVQLFKPRISKLMKEEINPDILHPNFYHEQQIGDYIYIAKYLEGNSLRVSCKKGNTVIGIADFEVYGLGADRRLVSNWSHVKQEYRGQGIASTMYAYAKMLGNDIYPSEVQLSPGKAMWNAWDKSGEAEHLMKEDEPIKIGNNDAAKAWIEKVYAKYPTIFQNNHVMMWGEGDTQQFAMFELTPSFSKRGAVEVKWFQAYPLRQGVGSRAMKELQAMAQADGIALTLFPWQHGQVSQSKLTKFYKGQGFVPIHKGSKSMKWDPTVGEAMDQGTKWTGDEPYRQLVELDDLEEDWKNWVAGGAMALGALGAANQYNSPVEPVRTAKISKITQPDAAPEVQVKAATPVVKAASPTVDTQAENVLYQTAKKEGMKGSELAQFLAQAKHETWNFSRLQEKPQPKVKDYFAKKYDVKHSPRTAKILGNKQVGDGARYHGRGYIQLTGRDNYRMAGDALKINLLKQPELAARPDIALKVALWYWNTRVKPGINNFDDTAAVTKKINSSLSGLEDRHANFIDYKKRIKST